MSRTVKGAKAVGFEFWSKRPGKGGNGPIGKQITHRTERRLNNREAQKAKSEGWDD